MGRVKVAKPKREEPKGVSLEWIESQEIVLIRNGEPGKKESVLVNDEEYEVEFDESGVAELSFESSDRPVFYSVQVKGNHQRLGFLY